MQHDFTVRRVYAGVRGLPGGGGAAAGRARLGRALLPHARAARRRLAVPHGADRHHLTHRRVRAAALQAPQEGDRGGVRRHLRARAAHGLPGEEGGQLLPLCANTGIASLVLVMTSTTQRFFGSKISNETLFVLSPCSGRDLLGGAAGPLRVVLVAAGDRAADMRLRRLGVHRARHLDQHPRHARIRARLVLEGLLEVSLPDHSAGEYTHIEKTKNVQNL